jgi:3-isopropylmalate/(R)-2-methylmalate dehydratase small subunit
MEKFISHTGTGVPLRRSNVDTDQIIPAVYLKRVTRSGFEDGLFAAWRNDPEFVLNQPQFKDGTVLVAGPEFGTGSSREHAVWSLMEYGFRCVIAPSFADIFFSNCFKNGLLPIVQPESVVGALFDAVLAFPGYALTIDLERQVIVKPQGEEIPFEVQPFRKYCLLNGFDDIGLTLRHADRIRAFEAERLARMPWLDHRMVG